MPLLERCRFALYVTVRPFNGFWEMKYERKGKLAVALGIVLLLLLVIVLKRQYTGFIMNYNNPYELNSLEELKYLLLPIVLWTVANWSLTTLMDGEGKFGEIVMATAYALTPIVIVTVFTTAASNFATGPESSLLYLLDTVSVVWFLFLLFAGIMTVHQYTVAKTLATIFLTLVVMGIIVFLGLLFFSLIQQIAVFFYTVYQEIMIRK